ncbi:MAG TPA: hypothetical protein VHF22_03110 [Planctomycetota bacterium]|nr:hypothetical protein [Planctomycetota bacterium]
MRSKAVGTFALVVGLCAGCGTGGGGGGSSGSVASPFPPLGGSSSGSGHVTVGSGGSTGGSTAGSGSAGGSTTGSSTGSSSGSSSGSSASKPTGATGNPTVPTGSTSGSGSGGGASSSSGGSGSSGSSSSGSSSSGGSAGSGTSSGTGTGTGTGGSGATGGSTSSGSSGGGSGSSSGGSSSSGGGSGGGGTTAPSAQPFIHIYTNSSDGTIFEYDITDWSKETVVVRGTGAFSISSGPLANTLYLQLASSGFPYGPLTTYNLVTHQWGNEYGGVNGDAFGEGRNGLLYSGDGVSFYSVDPASGSSRYVGDGQYTDAGDIAVDPTTTVMYAAVYGPRGISLCTVNRGTGAQAIVGSLGVSGDIWGLGFSDNGNLFACGPNGQGGGAIYQIDKGSGHATAVKSLSYEPYDMATQPYSVPEDQWPSQAPAGVAAGGVEYRWTLWGLKRVN